MVWDRWYGFNAGSAIGSSATAVQAFLNTHMAACTGMVTWLFCDYFR
jgi:Amt family ammonium transporter